MKMLSGCAQFCRNHPSRALIVLCLIGMAAIMLLTSYGIWNSVGSAWIVYCLTVAVLYMCILHDAAASLRRSRRVEEPLLAVAFFVLSILLIFAFAFPWSNFAKVIVDGKAQTFPSLVNAVYLSASVLTTLGFGDIVPANDASKIYLIFEVVFGITHMVASFSIIASRILGQQMPPSSSKLASD